MVIGNVVFFHPFFNVPFEKKNEQKFEIMSISCMQNSVQMATILLYDMQKYVRCITIHKD